MESGGDSDDADDRRGHAPRPGLGQLPRAESNRTLVDVIRDDPKDGGAGGGGSGAGKRSWRHFKDKLKQGDIGSRGAAWTPTVPVPASDIPLGGSRRHPSSTRIGPMLDAQDLPGGGNRSMSLERRSPSLARNSSRSTERFETRKQLIREDMNTEEEEEEEDEEEEEVEEERAPVRMSLMSLLMDDEDEKEGIDGLAYMMEDEDDDDEEEEEEDGGEYNNCCVCMVRHKGSSFVPCGHSFCRLCSREMWVEERGSNCPLCNNYILEILDIF